MVDIVVPPLSESVVDATVAEWLVSVGDSVETGDILVVLETDKVALEVTAETAGSISEIVAQEEEDVVPGQVLARMNAGAGASPAPAKAEAPVATPVAAPVAQAASATADSGVKATPVAQRMAQEHGVDLSQIPANGKKIDKADVQAFINSNGNGAQASAPAPAKPTPKATPEQRDLRDDEERSKMSRLRRTIAKNLVHAQATAAMLT
ncbi:MAG: biotin/lipoyl-containing protein, partial [Chloroflexota bacterium]